MPLGGAARLRRTVRAAAQSGERAMKLHRRWPALAGALVVSSAVLAAPPSVQLVSPTLTAVSQDSSVQCTIVNLSARDQSVEIWMYNSLGEAVGHNWIDRRARRLRRRQHAARLLSGRELLPLRRSQRAKRGGLSRVDQRAQVRLRHHRRASRVLIDDTVNVLPSTLIAVSRCLRRRRNRLPVASGAFASRLDRTLRESASRERHAIRRWGGCAARRRSLDTTCASVRQARRGAGRGGDGAGRRLRERSGGRVRSVGSSATRLSSRRT